MEITSLGGSSPFEHLVVLEKETCGMNRELMSEAVSVSLRGTRQSALDAGYCIREEEIDPEQ